MRIIAKAGNGGDGVVRWRQEKFKPKAGPAGGNGGNGGDVYVRAVRNLSILSKYTGEKSFSAEPGEAGRSLSQFGKNGHDITIDIPVGSRVTDLSRDRLFELNEEGDIHKILKGGRGGLGNEYFKSSTNRSPMQSTKGKKGETGEFLIELLLVADVGFIGLPNAGKSTLLNSFTNATSEVGAYPFTTLVPHLGDLYGFVLADIPGLIEGAAEGKGLGHKFLRHIEKTHMLLHLVSLENADPVSSYYAIRDELADYGKSIDSKEEWIVLTKKDLVEQAKIDRVTHDLDRLKKRVFVISCENGDGVQELRDALVQHLREG